MLHPVSNPLHQARSRGYGRAFFAWTLLTVLLLHAHAPVSAQLLDNQSSYDRQDTLRGSLRPERNAYDVHFYHLDIFVDPASRRIGGKVDVAFEAKLPEQRIQFDLFENMELDSIVDDQGRVLPFRRDGNAFFVEMPQPLKPGAFYSLSIAYNGEPIAAKNAPWDGGFTWSEDEQGKPWIGVSCEGIGASLWWPNKDHPTEEPDSMAISVRVPDGLVFVGNGNLRGVWQPDSGWTQYDWFVANPINNYNVTLNIGDYVRFADTFHSAAGKLALDYYVLPYNLDKAREQFQQVLPMMECYERYFDPYPFMEDGFALVETPYLGMEHQSAIAYGNGYKPGYNGYDFSRIGLDFDYIIIHETGHEWWGNSITCADMADLWIHEGFCTYSEALYVECLHGYDTALLYVNAKKPSVGNKHPIVGDYGVNGEGDGDMYNKGMLILNTLRHVAADDEAWFAAIRGLTVDYKHSVVSSAQVEAYLAEKLDLDLDAFWDQYLRHPKLPVLEYRWAGKKKKPVLEYRWVADAEAFSMPIAYRLNGEGETERNTNWLRIRPTAEWQSMELPKGTERADLEWDELHYYYKLKKVGA
jgi:aminopeptidase N